MRASKKKINASLSKEFKNMLLQTLVDIKSMDQAQTFLEDFLTEAELEMLSKRLAIAYWLKKGRSYNNIKDNIQVSSATIASVQNIMDNDGIKFALRHIEADEWAEKWSERFKKITGRS